MGYGLEVKGGNGQILFNTDEGGIFLDMVATSAQSYSNNTTVSYNDGDMVFARPSISSSVNHLSAYDDSSNNYVRFYGSGTYILLKATNTLSGSVPAAGDYGLIIYDGTGYQQSDILFSTSRTKNKAINIQTVYDAGSRSGALADSNSLIASNNSGLYVTVHGSIASSATPVSFTRANYIFYNNHGTFGSNIRFNSYISGGFPINGTIYFTNEQSVLVASVRG